MKNILNLVTSPLTNLTTIQGSKTILEMIIKFFLTLSFMKTDIQNLIRWHSTQTIWSTCIDDLKPPQVTLMTNDSDLLTKAPTVLNQWNISIPNTHYGIATPKRLPEKLFLTAFNTQITSFLHSSLRCTFRLTNITDLTSLASP